MQSWTFVPNLYQFADPEFPWNAPRTDSVRFSNTNISENKNADFVGIKMGDVSGNASASNLVDLDTRSHNSIPVQLSKEDITNSEEIFVHLKLLKDKETSGIQFTMEFDQQVYEFLGISSDILSISDENIGLFNVDKGIISVSWDDIDERLIVKNSPFKSFRFKKLNQSENPEFRITSRITKAELYSENLNYNIQTVNSEFKMMSLVNSIIDENFILHYQDGECKPIELRIIGMRGQWEMSFESQICSGNNIIQIPGNSRFTKGIYLLEAKTEAYTYLVCFIKI